ncbi:hypothetical protein HU230_0033315 [Bradyrhizobium quebecense]|uniref:Rap1a immunity protein domain-containing protein n=1 Tax=Bradyrhizobium quebecense TaxID=2748629 RepID=A0A974AE73_9BRAD|nr:hypothetical protein [Bradyrhizobium quebecense]UGA43108.1 hypothetical protein HU230_0033315 [Bradyrhizobium quebecense]
MSGSVAAVGVGTATCGQYSTLYKANSEETEKHFIGWLDGFLSGLNVYALRKGERSKNLGSLQARKSLLHNYCDEHPLQDVGKAAMAIYDSLPANPPK